MKRVIVDTEKIQRYSIKENPLLGGFDTLYDNDGGLISFSDLKDCPEAPSCEECKERLIHEIEMGFLTRDSGMPDWLRKIIDNMPFTEEVKDETSQETSCS